MPKRKYKTYDKPIPKSTFYRNKWEIGSQLTQSSEIRYDIEKKPEFQHNFVTVTENFQDNDDNSNKR
jgi:hypothetical protein